MSTNYPYGVGLSNVGSYQVSGVPFVTGSITAPISTNTPVQISFPDITQRVIVQNTGGQHLRVGFSANGVKGTNYFLVHSHTGGTPSTFNSTEFKVKVSSIFILSDDASSTTTACVSAELTNISTSHLQNSGINGTGLNWTGSVGVG